MINILKYLTITGLVSVATLSKGYAQVQSWTSAETGQTISATFVSLEGNQITLRLTNNQVSTFDVNILSPSDIERARELARTQNNQPTRPNPAEGENLILDAVNGDISVLDGDDFDKADIAGNPQVFILYFSASWCPPCRNYAPTSVQFYNDEIADNPNVEFIHVSLDNSADAAEQWASSENMPWPTLLPGENDERIIYQHQPSGIPKMVLVDAQGNKLAEGNAQAMRRGINRHSGE